MMEWWYQSAEERMSAPTVYPPPPLLKRETTNTEFNFHPKCHQLAITHLAFADDLMLMARGDPLSVKIIIDSLHKFESVSGLGINSLKSNLFTAGIWGHELDVIQGIVNFPRGTMPFRYLGIPLAAQQLKVMHYSPLLDKIYALINSWSGCKLSYAGRAELLRSVIQGIECFWLSILPIPATVLSKIISTCRLFLWSRRNPLVAWKNVCLPKAEGGLGFKDIKSWNKALLIQNLWNIHSKKDTLWIRWVNDVFLKGKSIWDWQPKKGDSPLLKNLASIRDSLVSLSSSRQVAILLLTKWSTGQNFNSSSAYDFLRPKGTAKPWANIVWRHFITPKHSFILWLCASSRILTKDRIHLQDIDTTCVFCSKETETIQHLFFGCDFSTIVWKEIRDWIGLTRSMSTIPSALKWLKKEARGSSWQMKAKKIALASTVYHLWNARNKKIFEDEAPRATFIVQKIKTHVAKEGIPLPPDRTLCPLCLQKRTNPSVMAVSGFVFCYTCVFKYASQYKRCPVTLMPATVDQIRRLFHDV